MALRKTPQADRSRFAVLDRQLGWVIALSVTIAAFTVPLPEDEAVVVMDGVQEVIELQDVERTEQTEPPPPPPPAAPPPREVPDAVEVEDAVIEDVALDLGAVVLPPPAPPVVAPPPPAAPQAAAPPPPPPPPDPEPVEPEVFEVAEVQPTLIGGIQGLQARVEYPDFAKQAGIEGQVVVQFVVDERGRVVDPEVVRSPNVLLSEAALAAVLASEFTPGQQRGRPVRVRFAIPVTFRLVDR